MSDQDLCSVPANKSVSKPLAVQSSFSNLKRCRTASSYGAAPRAVAPAMEQDQCSCPELPADSGDELFGPGDDALLVFRRAAAQGALRDALAGRAAELSFSADTVLSQLVGQCFTQCAPQRPSLCFVQRCGSVWPCSHFCHTLKMTGPCSRSAAILSRVHSCVCHISARGTPRV